MTGVANNPIFRLGLKPSGGWSILAYKSGELSTAFE